MNSNQNPNEVPAHVLRKRKMMIFLPVLIIPFITMAFWAIGGGTPDTDVKQTIDTGLNMQLPNAHLKDDSYENKLSFYEEADKDSIKAGNAIHNDLSFNKLNSIDTVALRQDGSVNLLSVEGKDTNEIKVYQRLAALNQQINAPGQPLTTHLTNEPLSSGGNADDVKRLDKLLQGMNNNSTPTDDDDLNRLDGMMDKIITIQHPETLREKSNYKKDSSNNSTCQPPIKQPQTSACWIQAKQHTEMMMTSSSVFQMTQQQVSIMQ